MRPVRKAKPGDTLMITNSWGSTFPHVVALTYDPYNTAKDALVANLGSYCTYCEAHLPQSNIAVEHIRPKVKHPHLSVQWDNMALACSVCNSSKKDKDVDFSTTAFPTLDNTFRLLRYLPDGSVVIAPGLDASDSSRVANLVSLVGLDRHPGAPKKPTERDRRWMKRAENWNLARRMLKAYNSGALDADDICQLALATGNWSVWMSVFASCPDVVEALVKNFPSTDLTK